MSEDDKSRVQRPGMRKPKVNPTEQRKRFLALATQLRDGTPLTQEQTEYLARGFERIGHGEGADVVFCLKRQPGSKVKNEEHRVKMSLVFAQIAHYTAPLDGYPPGAGLTLAAAFEEVSPLARALLGDEDSESYSPEYLQKLWSDPSYAHLRTTLRTPFDPDSPLPFVPPAT